MTRTIGHTHSRSFRILFFYISQEFLFSFLVSFLFFFFIFFINQLLLLAEDILSKHVPFKDVLLLVVYSFPLIISLSVPFASLVGALMAVGRISSDNEVLALRASGIPQKRIFVPLLILGLIFSLISFTVNDYFLPKGTVNFLKLYRTLIYSNPEIELESFSIKRYQDSIIITGKVEGNKLNRVIIFDTTEEKDKRVITAGRALLVDAEDQQGVISLELNNVFSQTVDSKKRNRFEYTHSDRMIYNILLKDITFSIRNPGPGEMRSLDVYRIIQTKQESLQDKLDAHRRNLDRRRFDLKQEYLSALETLETRGGTFDDAVKNLQNMYIDYLSIKNKKVTDRSLQLYRLEFYKKFSIPFACIVFIVFAFPVGLFTKRSGRSVGFGIGLFISVLYWSILFAGQTLGVRSGFSPFLSMWAPNFIMLFLGFFFFVLRLKR